mmetsp:Transcript_46595/g.116728  ORF Transcript_46595/g.116728 Transcript_46595/m.116728 type:complete len:923 (-) Transcript_46595:217-2985(-)|eukprot:CAMPEP_0173441768 /NCGR_PEP_ID=MMETSP1357-20121228/24130_1 /TAXON_ID=77926 /ORGANISM="Hemiselmis rufescens, Strain PCC563" /LENGTH=922 /DNA_ID=CAMNT_0014407367 /DNA_START=22 /DNA_END=2790 /DNA_ORIENTATION=-
MATLVDDPDRLPVIPINPEECHVQRIVDFQDEENVKKFMRPNRWLSINLGPIKLIRMNWVVFSMATVVLWSFIIGTLLSPVDEAGTNLALKTFSDVWQVWITANFTWLYIATQDAWIVFVVYLAFSKYGDLKLGKKNEKPVISDVTWFAMLFTCGVAVGFYALGVSEPITYYRPGNYYGNLRKSGFETDDQRAQQALFITLYHWGFHAWGCYIVCALLLAFVCYRWDMPLTLRSAFYPMVGDVVNGILGDFIDALSMVCTTFGVCTSLGLGVNVVIAGLHRINCGSGIESECKNFNVPAVGDTEAYKNWAVGTILVVTLIATGSVMLGLDRGLKNMALIAFSLGNLLLVSLVMLDNKWFLLNSYVQSLGHYFQWIIQVGFETDAWPLLNLEFSRSNGNEIWDQQFGERNLINTVEAATGMEMEDPVEHFGSHQPTWMHWWTIFYWGWWISWVPFVGMFIARISRGRTIRQVVIGGLLAPIGYTFFFLIILGSLGIKMQRTAELALHETVTIDMTGPDCSKMGYEGGQPFSEAAKNLANAGYYALSCRASDERLYDAMEPYGDGIATYLHLLCVLGVTLYFVTSSDSGSYVDDTLSAGGLVEPPEFQRVYWCLTEGMCAVGLFWGGGGQALRALRAVSVCMGLPLTFVLCFMCASLLRAAKYDVGEPEIRKATRFITGLWDFTEGWQPRFVNSSVLPNVPTRIGSLVLSLFAPFLAMHSMHLRLFSPSAALMNTAAMAVPFAVWIAMMISEVAVPNASFIGWSFFMFFVIHLTSIRVMARHAYNVYGWFVEDFAACLFMYPFVCSQMELQAKAVAVVVKPGQDPNANLNKELDADRDAYYNQNPSKKAPAVASKDIAGKDMSTISSQASYAFPGGSTRYVGPYPQMPEQMPAQMPPQMPSQGMPYSMPGQGPVVSPMMPPYGY